MPSTRRSRLIFAWARTATGKRALVTCSLPAFGFVQSAFCNLFLAFSKRPVLAERLETDGGSAVGNHDLEGGVRKVDVGFELTDGRVEIDARRGGCGSQAQLLRKLPLPDEVFDFPSVAAPAAHLPGVVATLKIEDRPALQVDR